MSFILLNANIFSVISCVLFIMVSGLVTPIYPTNYKFLVSTYLSSVSLPRLRSAIIAAASPEPEPLMAVN